MTTSFETTAHRSQMPALTGYLAADGFVEDLVAEFSGEVEEVHGRLVLASGPPRPAAWAANVWLNPVRIPISSISGAAKALRAIHRHWALYAFHLHRRAELIAAQLPPQPFHPLTFPPAEAASVAPDVRRGIPKPKIGSWTLLDENLVLASARCTSPFPNGEITFQEDREQPPSRAYLKLWELFTRLQTWPRAGARCVDLGAAPGGWTWVLQRLGATVIAVDKAPLDPRIAHLPRVESRRASAFAVGPEDVGPVDWLFSDVVCYPARLLKLVERWLAGGFNGSLVCTLKFQGKTDHAIARGFATIPGSHLLHLHHNGHELTWYRIAQ